MEVIYTDANRRDKGTLKKFSIDLDITDTMDFELTLGIQDNIMDGDCWWYIPDTEYAGRVDSMEVATESETLIYKGRNLRGILNSKIILPPAGQDYKIVSGNLCDIAQKMIQEAGLQDLFIIKKIDINVTSFKFNRYVTLYDGLAALAYAYNKVLSITCQTEKNGSECRLGHIAISFVDRIDYSGEVEFSNNDIHFRIKKSLSTVNHLICLGQGELKDRTVIHLYVDADGDIVEKQYYYGLEEYAAIYDNTSAASLEELKQGGANRLGELRNTDQMEVTTSRADLKIGDVVGGYEPITKTNIRREIVNIIVKGDDKGLSLDYKVGGDDPGAASLPSEIIDEYVLPIATNQILGGIKLGADLETDKDGTLQSNTLTEFKVALQKAENICA